MKTDMDKLRGKIVERGLTQEALAEEMGIDSSTLSRKMKLNGITFSVGEMHKIVDGLKLTKQEAKEIFLSD